MDKMKKKQVKRCVLWLLLAVLVTVLAVMPLLASSEAEEEGPQASTLSASVQKGSIEMSVKGGGVLEAGEAADITLPSGVKIKSFLVDNGDTVTKGTPVAEVDRVTVMNAIVLVRESMEELQEQIADAKDDTADSSLKASAGGRVKQVFAQPGDSVQDVMLEHGALAVLSLDGRMAVTLNKETSLGAGDSVTLRFGDGTEKTGRVESNLNSRLEVTVADEGYGVGAPVEVFTQAGDPVGSGSLCVHNAWKATGYTGTVQSVYAREDKTVAEGAVLFTLTDTAYTAQRDTLADLHREYEALLQDLFRMYESEVITAPCDGTVSGLDRKSPHLLCAEGADWEAQLLKSSGETGWTVMRLSDAQPALCTGTAKQGEPCQAEKHIEGCWKYCTGKADCKAEANDHKITCLTWCVSAESSDTCRAWNHKYSCIESCTGASETGKCPATGAHKPGCIESCISTDGKKDCPATGAHRDDCLERCDKTESCFATVHHYPECLTFCTGEKDCPALNHRESCYMAGLSYRARAAMVRQVGLSELIVAADTQTVYEIRAGENGWKLVEPAGLNTELMITEQTVAVENPASFKPGDVVLFWTGYDGEEAVASGKAVYANVGLNQDAMGGSMGAMGSVDMSGILGAMSGGFSMGGFSAGGYPSTGTQGEDLFPLDGEVLMTVTDQSVMHLTVTLDEQDISQIRQGQEAQVKIIALKGQVFSGVITKVGAEGTNSGGSSKFTAELELPYIEKAIAGMNATVEIPLYSKLDVLTLPIAALSEEGSRTVVYTGVDPESGDLTDPVEVVTGISDGETVEILSGLHAGDGVYYRYYETPELDHTAKSDLSF